MTLDRKDIERYSGQGSFLFYFGLPNLRKKLRISSLISRKPLTVMLRRTILTVETICMQEVRTMKISYKKLWIRLAEKEIPQVTLRKDLNIATGTMTKLRRNEEVALSVLLRICEYLDCNIGDICEAIKTETGE